MKKIVLPLCLMATPFATLAGSADVSFSEPKAEAKSNYWYVGGQIGAHDATGDFDNFDLLSGRLIVGYQFHPNFAVEGNLVGYEKLKGSVTFSDITETEFVNIKAKVGLSPEFDLLMKASKDFSNGLSAYGKLGVGVWRQSVDVKITETDTFLETVSVTKVSDKDSRLDLVGAVGLVIKTTENLSTDVSLTANWNEDFKDRYTLGVGVTYNIV